MLECGGMKDLSYRLDLQVVFISEKGAIVAYCPALDLSTCAQTEQEAAQRFAEAAHLFLEHCIQNNTIAEVLEECGWEATKDGSEDGSEILPGRNWLPPKILSGAKEVSVSI